MCSRSSDPPRHLHPPWKILSSLLLGSLDLQLDFTDHWIPYPLEQQGFSVSCGSTIITPVHYPLSYSLFQPYFSTSRTPTLHGPCPWRVGVRVGRPQLWPQLWSPYHISNDCSSKFGNSFCFYLVILRSKLCHELTFSPHSPSLSLLKVSSLLLRSSRIDFLHLYLFYMGDMKTTVHKSFYVPLFHRIPTHPWSYLSPVHHWPSQSVPSRSWLSRSRWYPLRHPRFVLYFWQGMISS